jgi:cell division septum initiation protein DivIVA
MEIKQLDILEEKVQILLENVRELKRENQDLKGKMESGTRVKSLSRDQVGRIRKRVRDMIELIEAL